MVTSARLPKGMLSSSPPPLRDVSPYQCPPGKVPLASIVPGEQIPAQGLDLSRIAEEMPGGRRSGRCSRGPCQENGTRSAHGGRLRMAGDSTAAEAGARLSGCRVDAHRVPGSTRTQQAPETAPAGCPCPGENTPRSPSPPATGHLREVTRASCPAPGAGSRSRRSAAAPRPPQPPGPARGSWRCRRRARFPGKTFPAPPPREGQSEREVPPVVRSPANRREACGERGRTRPAPDSRVRGGASRRAGANQQAGSKRSPTPSPAGPSSCLGRPKDAAPAKSLLI